MKGDLLPPPKWCTSTLGYLMSVGGPAAGLDYTIEAYCHACGETWPADHAGMLRHSKNDPAPLHVAKPVIEREPRIWDDEDDHCSECGRSW